MAASNVELTPTDILIREAQRLARTLTRNQTKRETRRVYIRRLARIVTELAKREET